MISKNSFDMHPQIDITVGQFNGIKYYYQMFVWGSGSKISSVGIQAVVKICGEGSFVIGWFVI